MTITLRFDVKISIFLHYALYLAAGWRLPRVMPFLPPPAHAIGATLPKSR